MSAWDALQKCLNQVLRRGGSDPSAPEVLEALSGRVGTAFREDRCYVASPGISGGERVVFRISEPLDFAAADRMRAQIATITLLSAVAALFLAFLAWRSLATRIGHLKDYAEALLDARPPENAEELLLATS